MAVGRREIRRSKAEACIKMCLHIMALGRPGWLLRRRPARFAPRWGHHGDAAHIADTERQTRLASRSAGLRTTDSAEHLWCSVWVKKFSSPANFLAGASSAVLPEGVEHDAGPRLTVRPFPARDVHSFTKRLLER